MGEKPTLKNFCAALFYDWATGMTGPLSLPLAIASYLFSNETVKIVLGITAFGCVWAAAYGVWRRERIERNLIEDKLSEFIASRAVLSPNNPYVIPIPGGGESWRIKISNDGGAARHVHLHLCGIEPAPKSDAWTSEYPYPVFQAGLTLDLNDCHINKGSAACFAITNIWNAAHDSGFLCSLDTKNSGLRNVPIAFGEKWTLRYKITAENSDPVPFTLRMSAEENGVVFE